MAITGIGSNALLTMGPIMDMRNQLDDLQRQLGTGHKSDTYAGQGLDRGLTVGLRSQLSSISGYQSTVTQVGVRLDLMQTALSQFSDIRVFVQNVPAIRIGGQLTKSLYQYTLQGTDTTELYRVAHDVEAKMRTLPGLVDVTSDLQITQPQITVDIDRNKASALGVSAQAIESTLYDAYGARQVSTIYAPSDQYWVVMELEPRYQTDPSVLSMLYVRSNSGALVPLNAVATLKPTTGPLTINHLGQLPSVTISFDLREGVALSQAIDEIRQATTQMNLPATINTSFQGTAQAFQASLKSTPLLVAAAILVVYIVLGVLYESYIHPITILSSLPSAGVGALLALMLLGYDLSVIAMIGVILLIGIVKKNAIMMIDFALQAERNEGKSPLDAIHEACLLRFRPIMMTTFAALFGAMPIAFGGGAGSELRRPLGVAMVGGLLVSQWLTLYTTPVVYLYLDRLARFLGASTRPSRLAEAVGAGPGPRLADEPRGAAE